METLTTAAIYIILVVVIVQLYLLLQLFKSLTIVNMILYEIGEILTIQLKTVSSNKEQMSKTDDEK